jgi:hypothetical protein
VSEGDYFTSARGWHASRAGCWLDDPRPRGPEVVLIQPSRTESRPNRSEDPWLPTRPGPRSTPRWAR